MSMTPAATGSPTRLRRALPWAVLGMLGVLAFGAYLRFAERGPLGIDAWWHGVATATRGSAAYAIAVFMAEAGDGIGAAACTAIAVALLIAVRRPRDAVAVASALLLGVLASETIKALVLRPRPWDQLYTAHGGSYPSGHSMGAAALAVSLALVVAGVRALPRAAARWAAAAATCWIALMMWSRTALHVHWLTDTLAGAVLGAGIAVVVRYAWFAPHRRVAGRRRG
ncbi:phosphatase PAP2 family protein [Leucobacter triazinivorans]|uniref:Phosphatase PAP2 family protein n=1 Tax=Leucobacter triazinivorans TaxID=1784719 RepID=A0A4P6KDJ1_9MICO|nr:phosphatase PAP2 family protein [Leucobacter triazinivorans]QBE48130.1 phosphatase PAP2 family protein [Leucobacter triazinivorans]